MVSRRLVALPPRSRLWWWLSPLWSIGSGESQAPTLGGWHAIAAQFVAVATDDWTPSTTVEVQLIQEKTANPFGGDSNAVLFDAITLVPGGDEIFADGFDP